MPSTSRTLLSVVVCTRDRAQLLRPMLESLCRQTLRSDGFEVVVVDDGSSDGTCEVALAFEPRLPLRYSYQRNAGPASARNHGLFMARGELLLFLDDGDVADPGLLEAHVEMHRRFQEPEIGVLGYTRLDPAIASDPLMQFLTEVGGVPFSFADLDDGDILDFTYFQSGRSSCKRSLLLDHGVFHQALHSGCEDVELGFRLSRRGFKVVYSRRAVSTKVEKVGYDEVCELLRRRGEASFVVSRLHEDEGLQRWTEVAEAGRSWRLFGPAHGLVLRSGRELDRIVRLRRELGLTVSASDLALLQRSYWAAFQASKIKGIVDKAAETGHDLAGDSGAPPASGSAQG